MEPPDEEIVAKVINGATNEYALLVTKYERPIYNVMYRFAENEQDAADLTQEVFVQSFAKLRTLNQGKGYFNWLYTIAINKGKDWKRSLRNRTSHTRWTEKEQGYHQPISPNVSTQEKTLQQQQEVEQLQKALLSLPAEKREPLILRYTHELPIKDIAEIFSLSESATKMRIKRSLEQLQMLLEKPVTGGRPS